MTKGVLSGMGVALCAAALVALLSCDSGLAYGIVHVSIVDGGAASAAGANARTGANPGASAPRTLLPSVQPASYRISFVGSTTVSPITSDSPSQVSQILRPGTWNILVEGLDSGQRTIARGDSGQLVIASGERVDVSIHVQAVAEGNGSVDIRLSWPAAGGSMPAVSGATVERDGSEVAAEAVSLDLAASPPSLRYTESLAAGSYSIVIRLHYGTSGSTVYDEALQVYANLASGKTKTLPQEYFTGLPEAPTGFTAVETATGLRLTWTDASGLETGYSVRRGDWPQATQLPANSAAWVDTSVVTGTSYHYTLVATNDTGTSAAAETDGLKAAPQPGGGGAVSVSEIRSSSLRLDWSAATDNHSPQSALGYQVLQNGVATGEPIVNGLSATMSGLVPETNYTFLVQVTDEAGCRSDYQTASARTLAETCTVNITIELIQPSELPMSFNVAEGQTISGPTLTVAISQSYGNYSWRLDGAEIATSPGVTIDCLAVRPGAHRLSLYVVVGSKLYSSSVNFRIVN